MTSWWKPSNIAVTDPLLLELLVDADAGSRSVNSWIRVGLSCNSNVSG